MQTLICSFETSSVQIDRIDCYQNDPEYLYSTFLIYILLFLNILICTNIIISLLRISWSSEKYTSTTTCLSVEVPAQLTCEFDAFAESKSLVSRNYNQFTGAKASAQLFDETLLINENREHVYEWIKHDRDPFIDFFPIKDAYLRVDFINGDYATFPLNVDPKGNISLGKSLESPLFSGSEQTTVIHVCEALVLALALYVVYVYEDGSKNPVDYDKDEAWKLLKL